MWLQLWHILPTLLKKVDFSPPELQKHIETGRYAKTETVWSRICPSVESDAFWRRLWSSKDKSAIVRKVAPPIREAVPKGWCSYQKRALLVCIVCLFCFVYLGGVLFVLFDTGSHYISLACLEFTTLDQAGLKFWNQILSQPPECWD